MAYFQTKNPDLGKYLEGLAMEDLEQFLAIYGFSFTGMVYGHLVYLGLFGTYMFFHFGNAAYETDS
jgi:hypothetical protein